MRDVEILILGAGLAGLGAGIEAQSRSRDSLILEAAPTPGGLCRGITVAGCMFDRYGPKVIVERPTSQELVQALGANVERHELREFVYASGLGLIGFPVQRHLVELPRTVRETVLAELSAARQKSDEIRNYRDWLLNLYGPSLCEKILFPYEEKKWQMPLVEMEYRWALARPVAVSYEDMMEGARRRLPANRTYFYPRRGNMSGMVDALVERAGPILVDSEVTSIDPIKRVVMVGGEAYRYRHLVSSLPLDAVVGMTVDRQAGIEMAAVADLRWLSVRVYNLVFEGKARLDGDAVYFPEPSISLRRVTILQNLCPGLSAPGRTSVSVEVALGSAHQRVSPGPDVPKIVEELRTVPQFSVLGRLLGSDVVDVVEAYPLQRNGLRDQVERLTWSYRRWCIWHCGRAGTFDYCDMDVAYQQGRRAVRLAIA